MEIRKGYHLQTEILKIFWKIVKIHGWIEPTKTTRDQVSERDDVEVRATLPNRTPLENAGLEPQREGADRGITRRALQNAPPAPALFAPIPNSAQKGSTPMQFTAQNIVLLAWALWTVKTLPTCFLFSNENNIHIHIHKYDWSTQKATVI